MNVKFYNPMQWLFKFICYGSLFLTISLSLITATVYAKNFGRSQPVIPITGQVTSAEDGTGLPGVTVVIKGASIGTVTDINGFYSIEVPSEESVLVFSFLGFFPEERIVGNQTEINVVMREDLKQLDEVVVVGYGTQERKDLTGAISSISAGDITSIPVTTLDQSLQGRMAGVQVTQADAAPGGGVTIKVRGGSSLSAGNEPLYVVDGYPILSNSIEFLNPNDIESIEVLKDASSTAIYGSRGSNGVVIITTKRGLAGEQPKVEFNAYYGVQDVRKKIDLLDAHSYAEITREAQLNANMTPSFTEEEVQAFDVGEGTDWPDEIFRTAPIQDYSLNVSGGTEKARYLVGGGFFQQDGIVKGSDFERGTFRANTDFSLGKVNIGSSITYQRSRREGFEGAAPGDGARERNIITSALFLSPTLPVRDENGELTFDDPIGVRSANPFHYIDHSSMESVSNHFLGNAYIEYSPQEWVVLRSTFGIDNAMTKSNLFLPADTPSGIQTQGWGEVGSSLNFNWLNENTVTLKPNLSEQHDLTILGGFSAQKNHFEDVQAISYGFANSSTGFNNLGAGENPQPPSTFASEYSFLSYFSRVNYNFMDRYLLTATIRRDGSSRFGRENKWGTFPSVSFGWRLSDEPFLEDIHFIDDLKLRIGYGSTGNSDIGQYQSLAQIQLGGGSRNYIIGNSELVGAANVRLGNSQLTWETTRQINTGIDLAFFSSRLTVTADYYIKNTKDLLASLPLPAFTGFGNILANSGEYRINGIELAIGGDVIRTSSTRWTSDFNISYNQNKIVDLPENRNPSYVGGSYFANANVQGGISRWEEGGAFGSFYGFVFDGLFQTQEEVNSLDQSAVGGSRLGGLKYKDLNGDGFISNDDDRQYIGRGIPDYIFGFSNTLRYKSLELSFLINGVFGNSVVNGINHYLRYPIAQTNLRAETKDYWKGPGTSNSIPRPDASASLPVFSSFLVEDGSFIRLRNISLGYTVPTGWSKGVLSQARIYISGSNLLTITDYTGFDPEVDSYDGRGVVPGVDSDAYPANKTYRIGVNLSF